MDDVIAAVATAWGEGGIAIVRLSGEGCISLLDRLFVPSRPPHSLAQSPARTLRHGHLHAAPHDRSPIDEVLAVRFSTQSYTGEESAEVHCHGGIVPAQRCLEALFSLGVRAALAGEFTRRAFTNGRIDLPQAEAVLGVIRAKSAGALAAGTRALQGELSARVKKNLENLTLLAARAEVLLDFPEEDDESQLASQLAPQLAAARDGLAETLRACEHGLTLRNGLSVALAGAPNVGKSSLLNALLGEERAIVTPIPGTTRDCLEGLFIHKGVPVRLFDTAGLRDTRDPVERIGVDRARRALLEADVKVWIVDAHEPLGEELPMHFLGKAFCPSMIVLNKTDLPARVAPEQLAALAPDVPAYSVSALERQGLETLKDAFLTFFCASSPTGIASVADEAYAATARQIECLKRSLESIDTAHEALEGNLGDDVAASMLAEARAALAELLGLDATESMLDELFGSFCVGK